MSGIYIKGMEMPKAGNWKTIRIYYDGTCAEPNWQGDCKYMQGCEAVPVPPHGRLIDADALIEDHFSDEHRIALSHANKVWMRKIIVDAPTIIEAEESEA